MVPYARSMGVLMRCITHPTVTSMTRMVNLRRDSTRANMVAQPLIKKPLAHLPQLSEKVERLKKANKKLKKSSKKCKC